MATITAYWRPTSITRAFELLERPGAVVLGGGTEINAAPSTDPVEVVDLQALGLDGIEAAADGVAVIGGSVTLQEIVDSEHLPVVVREAARREKPSTLRAQATLGGRVATGDPDSELLAALLVHEAVVRIERSGGVEDRPLERVLADHPLRGGAIVTAVTIRTDGVAAAARTARTRADTAIVAAFARDAGGRRRLALTGVAPTPVLVDGLEGVDPTGDFRGSSEYRRALAAALLARVSEAIA